MLNVDQFVFGLDLSHLFVAFVPVQFYSLLFLISAHVSYVSVQNVLTY